MDQKWELPSTRRNIGSVYCDTIFESVSSRNGYVFNIYFYYTYMNTVYVV